MQTRALRTALLTVLCAAATPVFVTQVASAAEGLCHHERIARVPLHDDQGFLNIPVEINKHAASMIVDTGAEGSLLSPEAAERFQVQLDPSVHTLMQGTGGMGRMVPNVVVRSLTLGGLETGPVSMPVGDLPGKPVTQPPVEGLVGGDLLSHYDVEFNVAEGWLTFWSVKSGSSACAGPADWHVIYRAVPLESAGRRVIVQVLLDDKPLRALVDSGARSRILSDKAAEKLGVSARTLAADPGGLTSGVDGHQQVYHWHRFQTFQIGQEQEKAPVLTVAPIHDSVDMLLGSDWFAAHRVWISYQTGMLYVMPALKRRN
ncbi:Aspartyl protease [Acetobacter malorum]|uniref:Aspartyl protease n=1 Tax=Acetobacter malorum TaxID=178901 RepID=A0A177GBL9_9PROT|nr:retroviral-like aspartic protease family protein [Acetobacter malorum]OAG77622.1 Aspartyl protease [Acetobacter malorum]